MRFIKILLLFCVGCVSTKNITINSNNSLLSDLNLKAVTALDFESSDLEVYQSAEFTRIQIRKIKVNSHQEAYDLIYRRYFEVERIYQINNEPYFNGTLEEKCDFKPSGKSVLKEDPTFESNINVLSGANFALGDCLRKNNKFVTKIEWIYCDKVVFEIKLHSLNLISSKKYFSCKN